MNGYTLGIAKRCGVPVRIAHCHNTDHLTTDPLRRILHTIQAKKAPYAATDLFACSQNAAAFFYGRHSGRSVILRNAIETENFAFSKEERNRVRKSFGIPEDAFLIGHVGRFDRQKNHSFLLGVFDGVLRIRPDSMLMLLGDGALKEEMQAKAAELGIDRKVLFPGYRQNVAAYYSAFDCFVLPSLFEGFGMVLLEAQSAGLRCVVSDPVPADACLDDCIRLPLTESCWIDSIASFSSYTYGEREKAGTLNRKKLAEKGYDIHSAAEELARFYEERLK